MAAQPFILTIDGVCFAIPTGFLYEMERNERDLTKWIRKKKTMRYEPRIRSCSDSCPHRKRTTIQIHTIDDAGARHGQECPSHINTVFWSGMYLSIVPAFHKQWDKLRQKQWCWANSPFCPAYSYRDKRRTRMACRIQLHTVHLRAKTGMAFLSHSLISHRKGIACRKHQL